MQNFNELNLPAALRASLTAMNFNTPTPIQAQAIPLALEGCDILGSVQTGTGKTGAFGIPLVAHVMNNRESMALVLTPTRELAGQVAAVIQQLLGHKSPIKTALLIGGDSMFKQMQQLKANPRIIIDTRASIASGGAARHTSRSILLPPDRTMPGRCPTARMSGRTIARLRPRGSAPARVARMARRRSASSLAQCARWRTVPSGLTR